jgi:hypothetical protein
MVPLLIIILLLVPRRSLGTSKESRFPTPPLPRGERDLESPSLDGRRKGEGDNCLK